MNLGYSDLTVENVSLFIRGALFMLQKMKDAKKIYMFEAAGHGHLSLLRYLIDPNEDFSMVDDNNLTLLHWASSGGDLPTIKFLIGIGSDVNRAGMDGKTPLMSASQNGYLDCVKLLCQMKADVNHSSKVGKTSLFFASQEGHTECVQYLIEKGSDVNHATIEGTTPLMYASNNGHLECVKHLCQMNANVNQVDKTGRTPLFYASQEGHIQCVQYLIEKGSDVNHATIEGTTPLMYASNNGHLDCVKHLCQMNANVNQVDTNNWTPLFYAIYKGHIGCVQFLIETGSDVNHAEIEGVTPLGLASNNGHLDCVKLLCQMNANVDHNDKIGLTPLFYASREGHTGCVQFLIKIGSDVNQFYKSGWTPLFWALQNGHLECAKVLIEEGSDLNAGIYGFTPLFLASESGYLDCVKLLCQMNANVNHIDRIYGRTPLFLASQNGHLKCVQYLIEKGSDVNHADIDGKTPLMSASQNGHLDSVKHLCQSRADIIVEDKKGRTSLTYAAVSDHIDCVMYIVEKEAELCNACSDRVLKEKDLKMLAATSLYGHVEVMLYILNKRHGIDIHVDRTYYKQDLIDSMCLFEVDNFFTRVQTCTNIMKRLADLTNNQKSLNEVAAILVTQLKRRQIDINYLKRRKQEISTLLSKSFTDKIVVRDMLNGIIISNENKIIMDSFEVQDIELGRGSFGTVKLGIVTCRTNDDYSIKVAVKCIDIYKHKADLSLLDQETECLMKLRNEYLVDFYGHKIQYDLLIGKTVIYLVTELCKEDLQKFYITNGTDNDCSPAKAIDFIKSLQQFCYHGVHILSGLEYIHSESYVHKDIKLANILLSFDNTAKICDFGLADLLEGGVQKTHTFKGTKIYSAPEVLNVPSRYSPASDMFSFGLLLTEMYRGLEYYKARPFSDKYETLNMLKKGVKPDIGDIKHEIELMVASIVDGCLELDFNKRLSAIEAKEKFQKVLNKLQSENPGLEALMTCRETFEVPSVSEIVTELISKTLSSKSYVQPASTLFQFQSSS